jgi:hypothetical protein
VSGLPRLPRGSAEEGRFHVYDALAELLRRAAAEAPVLVVLDDLQWADEASLLTLAFVARALPDSGVVLLGTYRTTEVPQDELGTSRLADLIGWSRRIELRGLAAADVRRLVEDRARDSAPDEVVERIHSRPTEIRSSSPSCSRCWATRAGSTTSRPAASCRCPRAFARRSGGGWRR